MKVTGISFILRGMARRLMRVSRQDPASAWGRRDSPPNPLDGLQHTAGIVLAADAQRVVEEVT